jgi:hypothetical protein
MVRVISGATMGEVARGVGLVPDIAGEDCDHATFESMVVPSKMAKTARDDAQNSPLNRARPRMA